MRNEPTPPPSPYIKQGPKGPEIDWPRLLRDLQWRNLFSFRVWLAAFFAAAILGALVAQLSEPLGQGTAILTLIICVFAALTPEHVLYCPHCRKRVKAGADTCHHCGRDVRQTAAT